MSREHAKARIQEYDNLQEIMKKIGICEEIKAIKTVLDEKNLSILSLIYVEELLWNEGLSFKELQEATLMNPSTLTNRLNQLLEHGFIKVEARPDRERRKVYRLTKKGLSLFEGGPLRKLAKVLGIMGSMMRKFAEELKNKRKINQSVQV